MEKKVELSQELEAFQDKVKDLRAAIRSIDEALTRLGGSEGLVTTSGKSLKELVLDLLGGQDEGFTPAQIADALTQNGRPTSPQSVSSTLSRLKGEGRADSSSHGVWYTKKNTSSESSDSDDAIEGLRDGSRDRRSTGFPEGSIPSSSTHSPLWEDDSEIPF